MAAIPQGAGSIDRKIRAEQIRTVYLYSPTTTIGSLIAGAFLVWTIWDRVPVGLISAWTAALALHQAVRVYHYRGYLRANPDPEQAGPWAGATRCLARPPGTTSSRASKRSDAYPT